MMFDACTIHRPGAPVTDAETGDVEPSSTEIYSGKCKVQSKDSSVASPEAAERKFTVVSRQVHIPAESADVVDNDVVTITASRFSSRLVGKQYVIDGFTPDSLDTAYRMPVKEITS
jgi:hypothetical protein